MANNSNLFSTKYLLNTKYFIKCLLGPFNTSLFKSHNHQLVITILIFFRKIKFLNINWLYEGHRPRKVRSKTETSSSLSMAPKPHSRLQHMAVALTPGSR